MNIRCSIRESRQPLDGKDATEVMEGSVRAIDCRADGRRKWASYARNRILWRMVSLF